MTLKEKVFNRIAKSVHGPFTVGPWGDVYLRRLSFGDALRLNACEDEAERRLLPIVLSICDADGNREFSDADMVELAKLPPDEIRAVVNDLDPLLSDINQAGDIAKNSQA